MRNGAPLSARMIAAWAAIQRTLPSVGTFDAELVCVRVRLIEREPQGFFDCLHVRGMNQRAQRCVGAGKTTGCETQQRFFRRRAVEDIAREIPVEHPDAPGLLCQRQALLAVAQAFDRLSLPRYVAQRSGRTHGPCWSTLVEGHAAGERHPPYRGVGGAPQSVFNVEPSARLWGPFVVCRRLKRNGRGASVFDQPLEILRHD
jgi:hypothetical protein